MPAHFFAQVRIICYLCNKNGMNKYKQSIDSTLHIPEFKGVNSGGVMS